MRNIFLYILLTALTFSSFTTQAQELDKNLLDFAKGFNKNCPIMADSVTRMDSLSVLKNKTIQFNFTFSANNFSVALFDKNVYPGIVNTVKNNADMKILRDYGVTFNYYYYDVKGAYIHKVSVTPAMYNK